MLIGIWMEIRMSHDENVSVVSLAKAEDHCEATRLDVLGSNMGHIHVGFFY